MTAMLYVRSVVPDPADRQAFDQWYGGNHSPQGLRLFNFRRYWRGWSHLDPSVHYAYYELDNAAHYDAIVETPEFAAMVADFTATWNGKVTRERDVITVSDSFQPTTAT